MTDSSPASGFKWPKINWVAVLFVVFLLLILVVVGYFAGYYLQEERNTRPATKTSRH